MLERDAGFIQVHYITRYSGPHMKLGTSVHPFWELVVMKSGAGRIYFPQHSLPLKTDALILVPPHCEHRESVPVLDIIWIGFEGSVMRHATPEITAVNAPELVQAASRLWQLSERRFGPIGFELDGGVLSLLGGLFRAEQERGQRSETDPVGKVMDWMHAHLADAIAFPKVASLAGVSEGYFYRLFKMRTGMTPAHYLNTIRIECAMRMLRTPQAKIAKVAAACGFPDPLYFSRVFKRHTGESPDSFRRRHAP